MRIGELAQAAGVSARTVRHYHQVGVLPEPARTAGGYRDYDLADLIRLVHARRLVELGLTLAEVGTLLDAEAEKSLAEILDAIDADLAQQERQLAARRVQLAQLRARTERGIEVADIGPGAVAEFRRAALAAGAGGAAFELDHQVMMLLPEQEAAEFIELLNELMRDPDRAARLVEVYARFDAMDEEWTAEDSIDLIATVKEILPASLLQKMAEWMPTDIYSEPVLSAAFAEMTPTQRAAGQEMLAAFMKRD